MRSAAVFFLQGALGKHQGMLPFFRPENRTQEHPGEHKSSGIPILTRICRLSARNRDDEGSRWVFRGI